ncbi:uncharacterized protein LOC131932001 isoform X2 [Physella acuta]|nr:uncharacterized protein LOC131932001 isoform X2 [Physella acuta]XP_059144834.1 uncharacterized protein LOC131932001 isoform X2 [Physella acuta]
MESTSCTSVLIYDGEGSDIESRKLLHRSLTAAVDKQVHAINYISAIEIKKGSWVKDCQLMVFGGGYDLGFEAAVGKNGAKIIQEFVKNGGSYLGLCAGAYWACDYIEFDKGGPLEVVGERYLKFFPGVCVGPAFPGFRYNSKRGAQAVPVLYNQTCTVDAYMHGGGYFIPYTDSNSTVTPTLYRKSHTSTDKVNLTAQSTAHVGNENVSISNSADGGMPLGLNTWQIINPSYEKIGVYSSLDSKPAAIVKCSVGKGKAVLSGVHIEFPVELLNDEDPFLQKWIPTFANSEKRRQLVFMDILQHLGVRVRPTKAVL